MSNEAISRQLSAVSRTCSVCGGPIRSDNMIGICHKTTTCSAAYDRERSKDSKVREHRREYNRELRKDPKVRERYNERRRELWKDPKIRERINENKRERRKDPKIREREILYGRAHGKFPLSLYKARRFVNSLIHQLQGGSDVKV